MKPVAVCIDSKMDEWSVLRIVLENLDFDVIRAPSLEEGDALVQGELPHLICLDLASPRSRRPQEAIHWLKTLRESPLRRIPVMVITEAAHRNWLTQTAKIGVEDFVLKPCNYHWLAHRLNGLLKGLSLNPLYSREFNDQPAQTGKIAVRAGITGISETGLRIASSFKVTSPIHEIQYQTPLFRMVGIRPPRLRLVHSTESPDSHESQSFLSTKEWSEKDRRGLREWMIHKQLEQVN